jgi:argininosuccinate lyase
MAFFWKLERDRGRLEDAARRTRVCPLGAGALAGNPFDIGRQALAEALGLGAATQNSIDAVSDRDYVVEFLAWAALTQIHLSNLAEDLITWASQEFGFVELDDAYTTGSSLMPQKKNPDSLELLRGKSGRVIGHLTALLTTLKGLPAAYNKDLQEDKEAVFDVIDTLELALPIAAGVIGTLNVNAERMKGALDDAMLATDLADYLVRKGVPFRRSHHVVGQAVRRAETLGVALNELGATEYEAIHPAFAEDVHEVFDFERSVGARRTKGGTAPSAVEEQIDRAKRILAEQSSISRI